jgi:hypothetical protein
MRYRPSDAAMVYLMGAAVAEAPSHRRAAAKLLLECFRTYQNEDEIRECLEVAGRVMPMVASEARAMACEAGLRLNWSEERSIRIPQDAALGG